MSLRKSTWLDPRLYGPATKFLRASRAWSPYVSAALAVAGMLILVRRDLTLGFALLITSLLVALIEPLATVMLRYLIGSGTNEELPVLLAALIPFASSSRGLVQLLVELPEKLKLRFLSMEARRLSYLLVTGMDERSALRFLADTTPSQALREVIRDLLNAEEMGTSRARIAATLYRKAMESLKASWASYVRMSEAITEGLVSLLVSLGVFIPILAMGSAASLTALFALSLMLAPAATAALAISRPRLAEPEGGTYMLIVSLVGAVTASLMIVKGQQLVAFAVLAPLAVLGELEWHKVRRALNESLAGLREAAERARLGLGFVEPLRRVRLLGRKLINSIAYASSIAGTGGSGAALEAFASVVSDAIISLRSVAAESALLTAISAVTPALTMVALKVLIAYSASQQYAALLIPPTLLGDALRMTIALAPLSPLPPVAMYRGRRISVLPSIASLAIALAVLKFIPL